MKKNLKELKEELFWLENNPCYIGKDGMPSPLLIIFILLTGIIWGFAILILVRHIKIKRLKRKINSLENLK